MAGQFQELQSRPSGPQGNGATRSHLRQVGRGLSHAQALPAKILLGRLCPVSGRSSMIERSIKAKMAAANKKQIRQQQREKDGRQPVEHNDGHAGYARHDAHRARPEDDRRADDAASLTNSSPENNAKQKPSIGSIVHYVSGYDGLHLAAIVTEVVAKSDVVGLRVFERDERSDFKLWEISFDEPTGRRARGTGRNGNKRDAGGRLPIAE